MPRASDIERRDLVERLAGDATIASVVAPGGYGKTTLMAQVATRDARAIAWLSLDPDVVEPVTMARYLALAIDRVTPVAPELIVELDGLHPRLQQVTVGLVAAMRAAAPFVLVLDDVHLVHDRRCIALLRSIAREIPPGSVVVFVSRGDLPVPLARARAAGSLVEIGTDDLRLDREDAVALLLRSAGAELSPATATEVAEGSEGWAVGVYLAGRALASTGGSAMPPIGGDDRFIADYVRETMLDDLEPRARDFLVQSSVLEELSGPLCDAALMVTGSGAMLASMERSNLLLVPLDRRRERYRFHHLFRDVLRRELDQTAPELIAPITARASAFCEREGLTDLAVAYAIAGGHVDRVVELVAGLAQSTYYGGRAAVVRGWMAWLDARIDLTQAPAIAALGGWMYAMEGRPLEAERWLDAAEPRDRAVPAEPEVEGVCALLASALTRRGITQMLADAGRGSELLAPGSPWTPTSALLSGIARLCLGDTSAARVDLEHAARMANEVGASVTNALALAEIAMACLAAGDIHEAASYADASRRVVERGGLQGYPPSTLTSAVVARVALVQGDPDRARAAVRVATQTERLTYALPTIAVQTDVLLGTCAMGLGDLAAADRALVHADEVLEHRSDLGVLDADVAAARAELDALRRSAVGAPSLTPAEARLLPLLTSHRSFREIGEELFVSPHTVKTQAISIYRKLGVSSRSEAVEAARAIGLLVP